MNYGDAVRFCGVDPESDEAPNEFSEAPWTAKKGCGDYTIFDDAGRPVAAVGGWGQHPATEHGDAALIAAAPDLLVAAEEAEGLISECWGPNAGGDHVQKVLEQIRAALAKARMEENR